MPQPVVASGVEATMTWLLTNGDVMVNVLHYSRDSSLDADGAEAFADNLVTQWNTYIRQHVHSGVELINVKVADMATTPWPTWDFPQSSLGTETTTAPLPYQLAVVASLRTVLAGRRGRGRIYLGGFTEASNTEAQRVSEALRVDIYNWVGEIGGFTAGGISFQLCVWSRASNVLSAFTLQSVDNRWDVQRRRANRRLI